MESKENLFFLGFLLIALANITGFFRFPVYSLTTFLMMMLIYYRRNLIIIFKTLPRDARGIYILIKLYRKLKEYEKKDWTEIDLFRCQLAKNPDKVLIYYEDQKWTFQDVEKFSNRVANMFQKAGFKKGDVVALLMGNCPEYACFWLGLGKIGVVTALINYNLRNDSLLHCLKVSSAKAIIFSDEYSSAVEEIRENIEEISKYQFPCKTESDALRAKNLKVLLEEALVSSPIINDKIGFKSEILYIYTSGTTGMPKPAIIPHHRLIFLSLATSCVLDIKEDEIVYNPLPLYHTAGGVIGIGGPLCYGYGVAIRKKFSASSYWPDCAKYNCTLAQYIGEMCRYIQMVPPRPEDSHHKVRTIFGNGMRPNIMKVFQERFNVERICELYGSTEGNTNIVNIDKKLGAVGFLPRIIPASLLPMALIKVNEKGEPLRNEKGFCIRCKTHEPGMFIGMILPNDTTRQYNGYVGNAKENQKKILENVFKQGDKAFLSGDILTMDELGYLYFKDRTGDTFRWKGENVSTTEVEEIIAAIIGLREVTVYGVEVGTLEGRAGMATIVDPHNEIDLELLHRELNRRLPSYARPLFLRLTNEVDMTGTFKLKKFDLQKEGFNPSIIKDRLYFYSDKNYIPLTVEIYDEIINGKIRI